MFRFAIFAIFALSVASCSKDDSTSSSMGKVNFEITDAPFDDANVQGVFVTVVAVKVDGKAIDNFSKTTIDLAAYQKGNTKVLGSADLQAKTYSNVTLVIDNATDQNGAAPGCYVMTKSNGKKAIASAATTTEILVNGNFKSTADQSSTAVVDFDLRKTIVYDGTSGYKFVTLSEMANGVRIVQKSESGVIKGTASNTAITSPALTGSPSRTLTSLTRPATFAARVASSPSMRPTVQIGFRREARDRSASIAVGTRPTMPARCCESRRSASANVRAGQPAAFRRAHASRALGTRGCDRSAATSECR